MHCSLPSLKLGHVTLANLEKGVLNSYMHREASPYFTKPLQRLSPRQQYFAALLFAFKLFASAMIIVSIVWQIMLPDEIDSKFGWFFARSDYFNAASLMNGLCLAASVIVLMGGLYQLLKHSHRTGWWSISFGGLLLILGLIFASYISSHSPDFSEILRQVC